MRNPALQRQSSGTPRTASVDTGTTYIASNKLNILFFCLNRLLFVNKYIHTSSQNDRHPDRIGHRTEGYLADNSSYVRKRWSVDARSSHGGVLGACTLPAHKRMPKCDVATAQHNHRNLLVAESSIAAVRGRQRRGVAVACIVSSPGRGRLERDGMLRACLLVLLALCQSLCEKCDRPLLEVSRTQRFL